MGKLRRAVAGRTAANKRQKLDDDGVESTDDADLQGKEEEDDLNYDEYDLSEECDMLVTCKTCDMVFKTLEKFITHKKSNCKSRRSTSKAAPGSSSADTAQLFSPTKSSSPPKIPASDHADNPEEDSEEASRKKKSGESDDSDLDEPQRIIRPVSKVYSSRRSRVPRLPAPQLADHGDEMDLIGTTANIANIAMSVSAMVTTTESIDVNERVRAQTLPDEVERISDGTNYDAAARVDAAAAKKKIMQKLAKEVSDSESEPDIDKLVSVVVTPREEEEESDPELPVEVKALPIDPRPISDYKAVNKTLPIAPTEPGAVTKKLTPYKLIGVETNTKKLLSQPSLALTFNQLKRVKVLNLVNPLPQPTNRVITIDKMTDGTMLGPVQTVLATTKDDHSVKLRLRRVIQPASTPQPPPPPPSVEASQQANTAEDGVESGEEGPAEDEADEGRHDVEMVMADGIAPEHSANQDMQQETIDPECEEVKPPAGQGFEDVNEDGIYELSKDQHDEDNEDNEFEHDPDLYEYLRDDEHYNLLPKQKGRISRLEIKSRQDCDWLTRRCFRCNTLYSCLKTLINHMSYQHADKKVFFPCIYCRNIYSQQKNVSRHLQKTHYKSKEFVDKLRAFVRSQSFIRQLKTLEKDNDKLTEDNDPFLRNLRHRVPPMDQPTRYSRISDEEMLARFGRKIKMIGRPPGRPSKCKTTNVSLTCTLCSASISSSREMLRHLKDVHEYSQKKVNKLKQKLLDKMSNIAVMEREKAVERDVIAMKPIEKEMGRSFTKSVLVKDCSIDSYGRILLNQSFGSQSVTASAASEHVILGGVASNTPGIQANSPTTGVRHTRVVPTNSYRQLEMGVQLLQCQTCSKVFTDYESLGKHAATCIPQSQASNHLFGIKVLSSPQEVAASTVTTHAQSTQPVVTTEQESTCKHETITEGQTYEDGDVYYKFIKAPSLSSYENVSGLETLAMISTSEANKSESPKATRIHPTTQDTAVEVASSSVARTDPIQHVTITVDQLDQLKSGGQNIIYVVKTASGEIEQIDDPHGMEVVEISQLSEEANIQF